MITKGEVKITFASETDDRDLATLKVGDSFGQYAFFTGTNRTATAISHGFSKAFRIPRADLLNVLSLLN